MSLSQLSRDAVLEMLEDRTLVAGKDYVLVDLRRTDFEGGYIRGSVNLPAQSLKATLSTLYTLLKSAGVRKVIWYCMSSRGRGTKAAILLNEYLNDQKDTEMESIILEGGIRGWATAGPKFSDWMEEYDASFWTASEKTT
ncbi:Rhodanese-like domain-containing protein [Xylariaceae sp. FL0016]|nr:Rhodanese-like domain-containing protein [Xylariaceae sp. FL0016]